MVLVDPENLHNIKAKHPDADLVALGSSRAKESIRPVLLASLFNATEPFNFAMHSGSSADQVNQYAHSQSAIPQNIIITVEPLHFASNRVIYDKKQNNDSKPTHAEQTQAGFYSKAQKAVDFAIEKNEAIQKKTSDTIGEYIYDLLLCSDPIYRSKLPVWYKTVADVYYNLKKKDFSTKTFLDPYFFWVINKSQRWFTKVVYEENGFEGHELFLQSTRVTRQDAFKAHASVYVHDVFPFVSDKYFSTFSKNIGKILQKGSSVILIRLPIYRDLYDLEQKHCPGFNDAMEKISNEHGIKYVNFNTSQYHWLTHNPQSFTDGSHMEYSITERFNTSLKTVLKEAIHSSNVAQQ